MNSLIDIHATHSEMKLLSLSHHVNTAIESNVTYYLSQSLWIERPSVSVEHWQLAISLSQSQSRRVNRPLDALMISGKKLRRDVDKIDDD